MTANRATAHLYIMSPLKGQTGNGLFDTHPPTEQRIAALRAMAHAEAREAALPAPTPV
jgi:heat shock protein HtpX